MKVLNAFITDSPYNGDRWARMTHVLLSSNPYTVPGDVVMDVRMTCGLAHVEETDYLDCPVASNWTLMRTP